MDVSVEAVRTTFRIPCESTYSARVNRGISRSSLRMYNAEDYLTTSTHAWESRVDTTN